MRLCIASGKGGTGKTTVATSLARVAADLGQSVAYVDCDVEDPNGHLFLHPELATSAPVSMSIPVVDLDLCTHCGMCEDICQFNAIVCLPDQILLFPEMCHSCGGCGMICPVGAIDESERAIGQIARGSAGQIRFINGRLNVGEAKSPPVIRATRSAVPKVDLEIVDAPPGTSCPVVESLRGSDFTILVTEPTPFGLNDLQLTVPVVRKPSIPVGVVVNRSGPEPLSVAQLVGRPAGAVIVTTPQDLAVADVRRCISFCREVSVPVVGIIENMSGYVCPKCGHHSDLFRSGGGRRLAEETGVPFLGRIPFEPGIVLAGDDGTPFLESPTGSEGTRTFTTIVHRILDWNPGE